MTIRRINAERLRQLRNEILLRDLVEEIGLPAEHRGGRLNFQCPRCTKFHTALHPRQNLGRCFRCDRTYNPIDLVMDARGATFIEAVAYLERLMPEPSHAGRPCATLQSAED